MEKNNCTIKKLESKLRDILRSQPKCILTKQAMEENNIHFKSVIFLHQAWEQIYFLCTDGVGSMQLENEDDFITGAVYIRKMNHLELHDLAGHIGNLKKEIDNVEEIIKTQKIRGIFAKLDQGGF